MVEFDEGSVFFVPLRSGGYARGVVARIASDRAGGVLGYFFGPKYDSQSVATSVTNLNPRDALKVLRFSDLSLRSGDWPVIGVLHNWTRTDWPVPNFVRRDELSKRAWRVTYADDNICHVIDESPERFDSGLERDAAFGAGAVELLLGRLLA